jgi:hypothetical protein
MLLGESLEGSESRVEGLLLLAGADRLSDTIDDVVDGLFALHSLVHVVQSNLVVETALDFIVDLGHASTVGGLQLKLDILALGLVDQCVGVWQRLEALLFNDQGIHALNNNDNHNLNESPSFNYGH